MKRIFSLFILFAAVFCICITANADAPTTYCPLCGHDAWSDEHLLLPATCTTDGYYGYRCLYCEEGIIKTSVVSAYGHNFSGRVCSNSGCSEPNPTALTSFTYSVDTCLYTYIAPSSTTLVPSVSPNTATGYVNYSVSPAGIVGLGTGTDSIIANASLNASLYIHAIKAGTAILSIEVFDGCGYYETYQETITVTGEPVPSATSIEVFPKSVTVEPEKSVSITANVLPSGADSTVLWYSDNPTVATVNNGVITGVGPGTATVTVASNSVKSLYTSIPVYVPDVKVTNLILSSKSVSLKAGGNTTISCEILPSNAVNKTLIWDSTDPTVAYVDSKGCIYGISDGVAVITVYSADKSVSDTCAVTVTESPTPSWTPVSIYTTYYSPGYYSTGLCYEDTNYAGFLEHTRGALYTRTGYSQTGWSLDYYGRTLDYNLYEAYTNTCDLNLYPYWTSNPSTPLKLTINYDSSLGTVYFNGKVFPSGHYWSIYEGETLNFSFVPISNYYASSIKLAGRYLGIYNNAFSVSYSDMYAANQSAYVNFTSIYGKPKTGDESNAALWLALGLLSMSGLGLAGTYTYRKKHKI